MSYCVVPIDGHLLFGTHFYLSISRFFFIVHFFAPQLQLRLDCERPYAISPLGSTPRTVTVESTNNETQYDLLGNDREEPTTAELSLTGKAYPIKDALERARARKKDFDKIVVATRTAAATTNKKERNTATTASSSCWTTGVEKTYTFQFLQHLFDYQNSRIDLGNFSQDIHPVLDGQGMQIMAEYGDKFLWAFEIWNEILLEDAKKYI